MLCLLKLYLNDNQKRKTYLNNLRKERLTFFIECKHFLWIKLLNSCWSGIFAVLYTNSRKTN